MIHARRRVTLSLDPHDFCPCQACGADRALVARAAVRAVLERNRDGAGARSLAEILTAARDAPDPPDPAAGPRVRFRAVDIR